MNNQEDKKFYYMKTQRKVSKNGKPYHTGKFSYAVDLVGFEKEDGTITWWLSPKDMDEMKKQSDARGGYQGQARGADAGAPRYAPPQAGLPKPPYVDHTKRQEAPSDLWDRDSDDEIPF